MIYKNEKYLPLIIVIIVLLIIGIIIYYLISYEYSIIPLEKGSCLAHGYSYAKDTPYSSCFMIDKGLIVYLQYYSDGSWGVYRQ